MFVLNNNGANLYTRSHKIVNSIPADETCVVYFGGEGIADSGKAGILSNILADQILLDMTDIPNIPNYAYIYDDSNQNASRKMQFERRNKNLMLKHMEDNDIYITEANVDTILNTKIIPGVRRGDFNLNLIIDSDIRQIKTKLTDIIENKLKPIFDQSVIDKVKSKIFVNPNPKNIYITEQNIDRVFKTHIIPLIQNPKYEFNLIIDGDTNKVRRLVEQKLQSIKPNVAVNLSKKIFPYSKIFETTYTQDLFNETILPRIIDKSGNRLPTDIAMRNIRKINFVTHCHGAYIALLLADIMTEKMAKLGYSKTDIKNVQSQMLVTALNPACPLSVTNIRIISFMSVYDTRLIRAQNWLTNFLDNKLEQENDKKREWKLKPGFLSGKNGEVFYVKQRFKLAGDGTVSSDEHNNMHYVHENLTDDGRMLMKWMRNIIMSGIRNSCAQTGGKLVPLPELNKLILDGKNDAEIKKLFTQMKQNGAKLISAAYKHATAVVGTRTKTKMPQTKTQSR